MKVTIDYVGNFTFEGKVEDLRQIYIAMDNWLTNLCFGERWLQNETAQTQWRPMVQEITESINDALDAWVKLERDEVFEKSDANAGK